MLVIIMSNNRQTKRKLDDGNEASVDDASTRLTYYFQAEHDDAAVTKDTTSNRYVDASHRHPLNAPPRRVRNIEPNLVEDPGSLWRMMEPDRVFQQNLEATRGPSADGLDNIMNTTTSTNNGGNVVHHHHLDSGVQRQGGFSWQTTSQTPSPLQQVQPEPWLTDRTANADGTGLDTEVWGPSWIEPNSTQQQFTSKPGDKGSMPKKKKRKIGSTINVSASSFSPIPINEDVPMKIVKKIPLLSSRSLLAHRDDMREVLRPMLKKDPPSFSMPKVPSKAAAAEIVATVTSSEEDAKMTPSTTVKKMMVMTAAASATASVPIINQMHPRLKSDGSLLANKEDQSCGNNSSESSDESTSSSSSSRAASGISIQARTKGSQWNDRFKELLEYINRYSHSNVPYRWTDNRSLGHWVKRQRCQWRMKQDGKRSNLTDERQSLLEGAGFVWDAREANWDERFAQLKAYKERHDSLHVSAIEGSPYRPLAAWFKRQRNHARKFLAASGDHSTGMNERRLNLLLDLEVELNEEHSAEGPPSYS